MPETHKPTHPLTHITCKQIEREDADNEGDKESESTGTGSGDSAWGASINSVGLSGANLVH